MSSLKQEHSKKHRILIVEDSKTLAGYLIRKLHENVEDVQIDFVTTSKALKERLKAEGQYALALVDIHLADMQGEELIGNILSKKIPTIVMAAQFDESLYHKYREQNIVDFVLKDSLEALTYIVNLTCRILKNRNTTVMVVDDSTVVLHQISDYLSNQLFEIKLEKDPLKALAYLEEDHDVQIVITDYNMPQMDGIVFLQKLRRRKKKDELGVIGISADTESATKFLKFGANDFINKPFHKEEFVHRVNNLAQNLENIKSLKAFANQDFLTKVHNRKYFFEEGERYFKNALQTHEAFAVAMLDIDNFKHVNDTYGHDVGDIVIKKLATILKESTKGSDFVARFGGEEFCLLLKNITPGAAEHFFQKICRKVSQAQIEIQPEQYLSFTVSIGVSTSCRESLTASIKQADINLYRAKQSGKNRVVTDLPKLQAQIC